MNIPIARNPLLTRTINPFLVNSLNPVVTAKLNPRVTLRRNPLLVPDLNPKIHAAINPCVTSSLNYRVTAGKNPNINPKLNPKVTKALNPNLIGNIRGLYLYDLKLHPTGFTVAQSDHFWLLFHIDLNFEAVAIRASATHFNIHNLDNEWVGYFSHVAGTFWLRFDLAGGWFGFSS